YSRKTRARLQSTSARTWLTRKRELGIKLPSMRGCLMKLRPKSSSCPEREVLCAGTVEMLCLSHGSGWPVQTWPAPAGRAPTGVHELSSGTKEDYFFTESLVTALSPSFLTVSALTVVSLVTIAVSCVCR